MFCHLSPPSLTPHHLSQDKAKGSDGSVLEKNFKRGDFERGVEKKESGKKLSLMKYSVLCYMFCFPRFLKGRHCVELGSLLLWLSIFWTKASVLSESNLTLCVGETFEGGTGHWG